MEVTVYDRLFQYLPTYSSLVTVVLTLSQKRCTVLHFFLFSKRPA